MSEAYTKKVFGEAAKKVIWDSFHNARVKAVAVYYKKELKSPMTNKDAKEIYLTKEQYLKSEVDWLCKDRAAWDWLCEYWASDDYINTSKQHRSNRKKKSGLHKYGADGHVGLAQSMVCLGTIIISFWTNKLVCNIEVCVAGGSNWRRSIFRGCLHRGTQRTRSDEQGYSVRSRGD